jgi:two-component system chemotaxis response regulator CheB
MASSNPAGESQHRDLVVVGASAGGVEALRAMVAGLPADLAAKLLIVLHIPRYAHSSLPKILSRAGPLPATHAVDGEPPCDGHIYVAPPDRHLLVLDGRLRLSRGPSENGHRPAVDPLFRSAARAYRERVIGVVLSGARDDGASGLASVVSHGGIAVVQEPGDALHSAMPLACLDQVRIDHVAPAGALGPLLARLSSERMPSLPRPAAPIGEAIPSLLPEEIDMADADTLDPNGTPGHPSGFSCPGCGGTLFEMEKEPVTGFRCRIGHVWSPDNLLAEHTVAMESAFEMALRALEEKAALAERVADRRRLHGQNQTAARFEQVAADALHAAALVRDFIGEMGAVQSPQPT